MHANSVTINYVEMQIHVGMNTFTCDCTFMKVMSIQNFDELGTY